MAQKPVYQTNADGWFTGPGIAFESPLEPGVFNIPAGAYEDAPLQSQPWPAGQALRRVNGIWELQPIPGYEPPAPPAPAPEPTAEEIQRQRMAAVQAHLDSQARELGYDNIFTAVTYAEEPAVPRFQIEGRALRAWRSFVWAACYQVLGEVLAGTRAVPTNEELIAELPTFEVPA